METLRKVIRSRTNPRKKTTEAEDNRPIPLPEKLHYTKDGTFITW